MSIQYQKDLAAQADYLRAAERLRGTAAGIEQVATCVVLDPGMGIYAEEVQNLKVRAYIGLVMALLDLAIEADEKAHSYDALLGIA